MGNAYKDGKLDFFPHDANFKKDYKVKLIVSEFGNDGPTVFWDILEQMYGDKGYYLEWDEDKCLLMAGELGFKKEYAEQIVNRLASRSLFDNKLFGSVRVLTSKRIQNNYVRACSERTKIRIRKELRLLENEDLEKLPEKVLKKLVFFEKNHEVKAIDLVVNAIKHGVNKQSTVEYSIENDSKGEDITVDKSTSGECETPVETVENLVLFFNKGKNAFEITKAYRNDLERQYPDVHFETEVWELQKWLNKTPNFNFEKTDIYKFINNCFEKVQKSGGIKKNNTDGELFDVEDFFEKEVRKQNGKAGSEKVNVQ